MDSMREALPRDAPIVRDSTVPAYLWGDRLLPVYEPGTSLSSVTSAIGPGLPLAVGAAVATGRKTLVIQGDGGFMLHLGEMATAAQYGLPIVICVFNDRGYGVLRSIEAARFEGRQFGVDLATPDFAAVARGMGLMAETVKGVDEFRSAFARAVDAPGPVLLDIDMSSLQPMGGLGTPRRRAS
jgi:acetolactate synthase-1/2/3 large subunit